MSWLKKSISAISDPAVLFGGLGVSILTFVISIPSDYYKKEERTKNEESSPKDQKISHNSGQNFFSADIAVGAEWKNIFITSKGFRARLLIRSMDVNREQLYIHSMSIKVNKIGNDKPDLTLIKNQGSVPITSILAINGDNGRIYWKTETGKCFRSIFPVDNILKIPTPPIMISLAPGEVHAIDTELVSEISGRFQTTLSIEFSSSNQSKSFEEKSMEFSSIGGKINENKNCR